MTERAADTTYNFRQLNELDHLDVDALRSLFTIELGGEAFYDAIAGCVSNERAARLLRNNAVKRGGDFDPSPDMLVTSAVRLPEKVDAAFFGLLIEAEEGGDTAYQRWADNEPDTDVQRLLRLNGREESIHGRRLEEVIALISGT
jgi:hypothetical protein